MEETYDYNNSFRDDKPAPDVKLKPASQAPDYMINFVKENPQFIVISFSSGSFHEKWAYFAVIKRDALGKFFIENKRYIYDPLK
jgi:hypothetical protein